MFSLYARIAVAVAIAIALAASHWKAYTHGKRIAEAEYTEQALKASEEAREKERLLNQSVAKLGEKNEQTKKANAVSAAAASSELDRLRNIIANRPESQPTASTCRVDVGRTERELLGQCAIALTELGQNADRLEAKLIGLQDYVRAISTP